MATPTITAVSPSTGPAFGKNVIEITGTNFRTRTGASWLITTTYVSTVQVLVNGVASAYAQAVSSTLIRCIVPECTQAYATVPHAAVSVTVTNLDDAGAAIAGETVTKTSAYTYLRAQLASSEELPPVMRVLDAFIKLCKRELSPETVLTTAPDYSDEGVDVIVLPKTPSINLRVDEDFDDDWCQWNMEHVLIDKGGGYYDEVTKIKHMRLTLDALVSGVGFAVASRLKTSFTDMIESNPYLQVTGDPRVSSLTQQFPMEIVSYPKQAAGSNAEGIFAFQMQATISGVPVLQNAEYRVRGISQIYLAAGLYTSGVFAGVAQL